MDLVAYLETLPAVHLAKLYKSPFTCLAVLRSLPPLAKQYVMRLVFLRKAIAEGNFIAYCAQKALIL